MKHLPFLLLLLLCAMPLAAEEAPKAHDSETDLYAESSLGEWSVTYALSWAPRYFNITENKVFDDAFTRRYLTGMEVFSMRWDAMFSYRVNHEETLKVTPTLSFGYSPYEFSANEIFGLETLPDRIEREAHFFGHHLSFDIGTQVGWRMGDWEPFIDWHSLFGFRFQEVATDQGVYRTAAGGFIDNVDEIVRDVTDKAQMHSWGLGLGYYFGRIPWEYRVSATIKPWNVAVYKGRSTTLWGFDIHLHAATLNLTDDSALYMGFRWEYWFPRDEFSSITTFEFNIGVRFS